MPALSFREHGGEEGLEPVRVLSTESTRTTPPEDAKAHAARVPLPYVHALWLFGGQKKPCSCGRQT